MGKYCVVCEGTGFFITDAKMITETQTSVLTAAKLATCKVCSKWSPAHIERRLRVLEEQLDNDE